MSTDNTPSSAVTESRETIAAKYAALQAQIIKTKTALKEAKAALKSAPRPRLEALNTREGLFASLWTRGISYHAQNGRPLTVEEMRSAVKTWDDAHTPEEAEKAREIAEKKLELAMASKGAGRGRGNRGAELFSPFRVAPVKRETALERKKRKAAEEATRIIQKTARILFGRELTEKEIERALPVFRRTTTGGRRVEGNELTGNGRKPLHTMPSSCDNCAVNAAGGCEDEGLSGLPAKQVLPPSEKEKIGGYARRELYSALEEGRVPEEDFEKLLTMEGTRDLLGYSMKTCPLFALKPMTRRDGRPGSYSHPARYKGRPVFVNGYWMERHRANLQKLLARWSNASSAFSHDEVKTGGEGDTLASFSADIREHWPEGFDFSEGAMRLLESRCGKMSNRVKEALKAEMFHPRGRLWFCSETVASDEAREAAVETATRFVREWGLVAVRVLSDILDVPETKLRDVQEREAFAVFLVRQAGLSVCELEGRAYVTSAGASDEEETAEALCGLVREFIAEQGGVVQTERILEEFKNLDEQSLSDLMARWEPDAIPERDENGFLSFKLLSEYYLPEDFGAALKEGLARAEEEGTPPTAAWLTTFLSERYGCDFAVDYALDPAGALKWVISAVWQKDEANDLRRWNGEGARARFVPMDEHEGATSPPRDLPTQVEMAFPGVFTNEDFWQYSVGHYGLSDTRAAKVAQLGYIAPCFVRLDRDHWMSVAAFRRATGWNDTISEAVAEVLREALGSSPMLPVASLGASVTDALPEVVLQGDDEPRVLRWTPELVASVAALLCPGLHVANHGVAPLAVTALLVPKPVATKDVFTYAMGLYCARNPHGRSVEGAFAFLKANSIAFRLTARARAEIEDYLVKEGG